MRLRFLSLMGISLGLTLFIACRQAPEVPDPEAGLPAFPKPAVQIDKVPLTRAEEAFVQAGNEFAWKLLRKVWDNNKTGEGFIISPISVQYALGMLGNGADPQTAAKLASVLGYEGTEAINAYCAKMIECLPQVDTTLTLALANGVLLDEKYTLKRPFKTAVEDSYDALVESMPFTRPEAVKKKVNDWCWKHTYGRIKEVLDQVDPDAFLYLMNAIYFNGKWTLPFEKSATRDENFRTLSGKTRKVKMMHQTYALMELGENELCQSVSLPYGRGKFFLNIYLPKKSTDLTRLMEDAAARSTKGGLYKVVLSLPSFETEYKEDLKPLLGEMGLPMGPYDELIEKASSSSEISRILHKANITVNESGTEAAAVTVIEMKFTSAGPSVPDPPTVYFTADHPFFYTISEKSTGAILFTGAYTGV
jgi:serpin B